VYAAAHEHCQLPGRLVHTLFGAAQTAPDAHSSISLQVGAEPQLPFAPHVRVAEPPLIE
jgi:hypothetical protein